MSKIFQGPGSSGNADLKGSKSLRYRGFLEINGPDGLLKYSIFCRHEIKNEKSHQKDTDKNTKHFVSSC